MRERSSGGRGGGGNRILPESSEGIKPEGELTFRAGVRISKAGDAFAADEKVCEPREFGRRSEVRLRPLTFGLKGHERNFCQSMTTTRNVHDVAG